MIGKLVTAVAALIPVLAPGANPAATYPNAKCLSLVPPAYGQQVWTRTTGKGRVPADIIANWGSTTVNPKTHGGPGTARDTADAATIKAAMKAGSTVIGYIWSGYGAVTAAQMQTQVRQWKSWYGVTDVFLDGAAASAPLPSAYRKVYAYVHARAKRAQVWANPGTLPAPQIMAVADVVNIFEGSYRTAPDNLLALKLPAWIRRYPAGRFAFIAYATTGSQMPNALRRIRSDHGGHAYVTDGNPATGNPYSTTPRYWRQEVASVNATCRQ